MLAVELVELVDMVNIAAVDTMDMAGNSSQIAATLRTCLNDSK